MWVPVLSPAHIFHYDSSVSTVYAKQISCFFHLCSPSTHSSVCVYVLVCSALHAIFIFIKTGKRAEGKLHARMNNRIHVHYFSSFLSFLFDPCCWLYIASSNRVVVDCATATRVLHERNATNYRIMRWIMCHVCNYRFSSKNSVSFSIFFTFKTWEYIFARKKHCL